VLIVLQIRLEVAVWGDTWYSTPNSQRMVEVDDEDVVVVVMVVVTVTHTRSEVAVGATLWYWYTVHTVRGMHTRLEVLV
jgi:hypothetical protein